MKLHTCALTAARRLVRARASCAASRAAAPLRALSSTTSGSSAADAARSAPVADEELDKFDIGKQAAQQADAAEDEQDEMYEDPREKILDAALAHVKRDGWSMEAIAAGANDLGYPSVASGMFDKGAVELVWHVMRKANTHMSATLEGADLASLSVNERVKVGVRARLLFFTRYNRTWAQAMAQGLQPSALPETLTQLAVAADEIWYWAGDRSTDLNWYTRRLLLMGVMASSETAMLTDRSEGFADTWEFLDRRLDDVSQFGRSVGDGLSIISTAAGGFGALATAGMDLLRPLIVRDGPLVYGAPSSTAARQSTCGMTSFPLPDLRPTAGAAVAAASVAQTVAAQAATVAARAGVPVPDPAALFSAICAVLPDAMGPGGAGGAYAQAGTASASSTQAQHRAQAASSASGGVVTGSGGVAQPKVVEASEAGEAAPSPAPHKPAMA